MIQDPTEQRGGEEAADSPAHDPTAGIGPVQRFLYLCAGLGLTGVGIVGAFLPLLPTTIFMILAAWCFGRSSPRFERWLLDHPRFGPPLRDWREHGAISRYSKMFAFAGMVLGFGLFLHGALPGLIAAFGLGAFLLACAIYVGTRPERP